MNTITESAYVLPHFRKSCWGLPLLAAFLVMLTAFAGPVRADDLPPPVEVAEGAVEETAEEEETGLSGKLEFDFNSGYLWRGFSFSKKWAFQPIIEAAYGPWSGWIWGNYLLEEEVNKNQFNEVEFHLAREWSLGPWTLSPFITWNTYPNLVDQAGSHEIGLEGSYPLNFPGKGWSLGFLGAVDQKDFHGALYGETSLSKEWRLSSRSDLSGKLWTGFGSPKFTEYFTGVRRSGIYVVGIDVSATIRLSRQWVLRPHVETCKILSADVRDATGDNNLTNVGLAIGWEFP